ncbi:MAG: S-ribosylhomocysteine lyase [Clostridia bacterium]|nr:S-ribosylhomocysteine lyase [Clostridia bacterium]
MRKITSFTVDHTKISEGMYISRIDGDITTYDLRMRKPNGGDYISIGAMHTMEHMFATFVRNSPLSDDIIYFGPMGCQTGFYLLVRNADHMRVFEEIKSVLENIINYNGEVFGNSEIECGNYRTLELSLAHYEAKRYLDVLLNWTDMTFSYIE